MSSNLVIPENELPNWMKQAQRGVDWAAILVLAFCLILAWPFFSQESLSALNDSEHYVYRASDYAEAMKEGHLYARWSPHALAGYGAEIPNFYPPGAAYTAALFEVLFTNDPIAAVRLTYIMAIILAGSMVYAFVKQRTNALSAVFASLIYIYSPFVALTAPHMQGDLALALGIALLPMFLWAINRLLMRNHTLDYIVIASVCAAIIITKPALLIQGFLLAMALVIAHSYRRKIEWAKLWLLFSAAIAGIGLAAFYWIPALLEQSFVKWSNPLIGAPKTELSFTGLFERTKLYDPSVLIHETQFNIGWLLLGFTILTVVSLIYWRKNLYFPLSFLTSSLVLSILGISLFSYNTELLAGIVLGLAIASSYPISMLSKNRIGLALSGTALMLVFVGAIPIWKLDKPQLVIDSNSNLSQQEYERNGWGIAVLQEGQAIPSFVSASNPNLPALSNDIVTTSRILGNSRFQTTVLEEGAFSASYRITTQEETLPDSIHYLRAYSIAWQAFINEQALEISPDSDGLIQVHLPAGFTIPLNSSAILSFSYGTTPIRIIAWLASAISLILITYIGWWRWQTIEFGFDTSDLLSRNQIILVGYFLLLGVLLRYQTTFDFLNSYIPYPVNDITENTISVKNDDAELVLWRFKFDERSYRAGEQVKMNLYWSLENPIKNQHQVRLRIISRENQTTIYTSQFRYPSYFPSNRWPSNLTSIDSFELPLSHDLEQGSYTIMIDVASCPRICLQGTAIAPQNITTIQLPRSLIIE